MSDNLVKTARDALKDAKIEPWQYSWYRNLIAQMADRIEELKAKQRKLALCLMSANDQAVDAYQAQLEAEAKLAKAVELIEGMPILATYGDHVNWKRTTLAELKGGKE